MAINLEKNHGWYSRPKPSEYQISLESHPETHERNVLGTARLLEVPLLTGTRAIYGEERCWSICGPTEILLANFTSAVTGVPFRQSFNTECKEKEEHIELDVLIHDPRKKGVKEFCKDHTVMRYYTGKDKKVIIIDTVGGLLWGNKTEPEGAFTFEAFPSPWLIPELTRNLDLYTYSYYKAANIGLDIWEEGQITQAQDWEDSVAIMHSPQVFNNRVVCQSGKERDVSEYWGTKLKLAAGKTIQHVEQSLLTKFDQIGNLPPLPGNLTVGEFLKRMETVPHIMPPDYQPTLHRLR